ncbi:MAG: hypothetical protein PVI75_01975 [Gammaproteobacteria bacterium]|jgi:hypothetical protein
MYEGIEKSVRLLSYYCDSNRCKTTSSKKNTEETKPLIIYNIKTKDTKIEICCCTHHKKDCISISYKICNGLTAYTGGFIAASSILFSLPSLFFLFLDKIVVKSDNPSPLGIFQVKDPTAKSLLISCGILGSVIIVLAQAPLSTYYTKLKVEYEINKHINCKKYLKKIRSFPLAILKKVDEYLGGTLRIFFPMLTFANFIKLGLPVSLISSDAIKFSIAFPLGIPGGIAIASGVEHLLSDNLPLLINSFDNFMSTIYSYLCKKCRKLGENKYSFFSCIQRKQIPTNLTNKQKRSFLLKGICRNFDALHKSKLLDLVDIINNHSKCLSKKQKAEFIARLLNKDIPLYKTVTTYSLMLSSAIIIIPGTLGFREQAENAFTDFWAMIGYTVPKILGYCIGLGSEFLFFIFYTLTIFRLLKSALNFIRCHKPDKNDSTNCNTKTALSKFGTLICLALSILCGLLLGITTIAITPVPEQLVLYIFVCIATLLTSTAGSIEGSFNFAQDTLPFTKSIQNKVMTIVGKLITFLTIASPAEIDKMWGQVHTNLKNFNWSEISNRCTTIIEETSQSNVNFENISEEKSKDTVTLQPGTYH